jgi:hyperosmotically inducible protein
MKRLFVNPRSGFSVALWATSFAFAASPATMQAAAFQNPQQPDSYSSSTPVPDPTPDPSDRSKTAVSDRAISQKIRQALAADKNLSPDARRVKILTQSGKVTLRGSVPSSSERATIVSKAAGIAGQGNVTDKIEVTSSKQ